MPTSRADLWQLISPALPVGAFHFSQGLEYAVGAGWVVDEPTALDWVRGVRNQLQAVDLPILDRVMRAWRGRDTARVVHWDRVCRACRDTAELRSEDADMGQALRRLAVALGEAVPDHRAGYTTLFAVMAANREIVAADALAGYAWAWCENQVLAAVKLVPLGHLAGQRLLQILGRELDAVVADAMRREDADIGSTLPGMLLASIGHETQYTRLFRS